MVTSLDVRLVRLRVAIAILKIPFCHYNTIAVLLLAVAIAFLVATALTVNVRSS